MTLFVYYKLCHFVLCVAGYTLNPFFWDGRMQASNSFSLDTDTTIFWLIVWDGFISFEFSSHSQSKYNWQKYLGRNVRQSLHVSFCVD